MPTTTWLIDEEWNLLAKTWWRRTVLRRKLGKATPAFHPSHANSMYHLQFLLADYPVLAALQGLLTLAMIVHAFRQGAEQWWYYIIIFVPVIGTWAYFVAVFVPRFDWKNFGWERKTPVEELRFRAQSSPTFASQLSLGQRLLELGRFEEAIEPLEGALKREPGHSPACYAMAKSLFELGKSEQAVPYLQRILDKEPRWEDYAAWRLLIQTQVDLHLDQAGLETARHLVKLSPRIEHKFLLANQLARLDQDGEARIVLENALEEQQFVSGPVRRLNRKWVKESKRLLGELTVR